LVAAVEGFKEAAGPAVAVVPVEGSAEGEAKVGFDGVGVVADEGVDPGFVGARIEPAGVEVSNDGCRVDKVPKVEVI
jgi:hypothetical protein